MPVQTPSSFLESAIDFRKGKTLCIIVYLATKSDCRGLVGFSSLTQALWQGWFL